MCHQEIWDRATDVDDILTELYKYDNPHSNGTI